MNYFTEEFEFEGRTWRLVFHKIPNYIWYGSRWLFASTLEDIQASTHEEIDTCNARSNMSKPGWFTRVDPKNQYTPWPAEAPEFVLGDRVRLISGSYPMTVVSNDYMGIYCCWNENTTLRERLFPPHALQKLPPEKPYCEKKFSLCSYDECCEDGVVTFDEEPWCEFHAVDNLLEFLSTDDARSVLELSSHCHLLLNYHSNPIQVWPFDKAPTLFQNLSSHGGDEDWIALIPKGQEIPSWADEGTRFGCCSVSEHELEDGRIVLIGAHS